MKLDLFSPIAAKILGVVALLAAVAAMVQTVRIEGLKIWPVEIAGLEQQLTDLARERDDERTAHQRTKDAYRLAQQQAAELDRQRIERVKVEQQEITDAVVKDYRARLADARAAVERERMRRAGEPAGAGAAGTAGRVELSATGDAAGRADEAAVDPELPPGADELEWRLVATEQAIQLDALISWVEAQGGVR